jgi:hypothetical protein
VLGMSPQASYRLHWRTSKTQFVAKQTRECGCSSLSRNPWVCRMQVMDMLFFCDVGWVWLEFVSASLVVVVNMGCMRVVTGNILEELFGEVIWPLLVVCVEWTSHLLSFYCFSVGLYRAVIDGRDGIAGAECWWYKLVASFNILKSPTIRYVNYPIIRYMSIQETCSARLKYKTGSNSRRLSRMVLKEDISYR